MRVISRLTDSGVEVFDADLALLRTFPADPATEGFAVPGSRDRLIYATDSAVRRIAPDGREEWRLDLGRRGPDAGFAETSVALSADESQVWVYAPNGMAGRDRADEWIVLDAATGTPVTRHPLPTKGHGGQQFALTDGRMLLDVGEGQDGSRCFLAGPDGDVRAVAWGSRVIVGISPDEKHVMTVNHDQSDATFHDFSDLSGAGVTVDAPDDHLLEWTGGYLTEDVAIIVLTDDDDSWKHHRVDTRTGEVLGELGIVTVDEYDLQPLGDGTYLITDTDGTLRRM
ncbi:hypothetical protein ACTI_25560 [Actinoplanes sp. OR16]|uniref:hypothetical protein n=1 Tax=Actinoplanes sp. OR16 TaxID=946334 RepID=UPI000F6E843E|nr:hypothetical protein [Actinoplanes sp. OR16]BBH65871.1 hypothetical protein ACTI_25560 [Actinoplanes sp. OR16]